jgi:hypothetical protein
MEGKPYLALLVAQLLFYVAAVGGRVLSRTRLTFAGITVPYTMCLLLWATIVGFARFARRTQQVTWERADLARFPPHLTTGRLHSR